MPGIDVFNVREYGAQGNGSSLDTAAIQGCIDSCARQGGGTVYFPNGSYLAGTLFLKNNITLNLAAGATLLGSSQEADYPEDVHRMRYDYHANMDRCLIYAENATNISLTGQGVIDGQAGLFRAEPEFQRPVMMRFLRCSNISLSGLRLTNPATWTTSFILCDRIFADKLDIDSRRTPNGNGLVFDSCQDVFVANCKINTSDDAICLQSSERDVPCRRIVIQNCILSSHYAGMKIGMLSLGNIEDVTVSNCVLHDMGCSGFKIQSAEGGNIRNLLFQNIVMRNVPRPVFITFNHYRCGLATPANVPKTGGVSYVKFDHLTISSDFSQAADPVSGFLITGNPGFPVDHLTFSNVDYIVCGGLSSALGESDEVPELADKRPEYYEFLPGLPARGAYIRHARHVTFKNFRVDRLTRDDRPDISVFAVEDFCNIL